VQQQLSILVAGAAKENRRATKFTATKAAKQNTTQRSTLSVVLIDTAEETVSHRKPLSWRQKPRKRSASATERRELHFQQREQTAQQLRTTRAKSSAKSQRTAAAPRCSSDRSEEANRIFWEIVKSRRSAATAGSADPQPLTPLSPHSDSEHSSWGQQEETSESEHCTDDEVIVPEEADTTERLKRELTEEPELAATPAVEASKKRPAEEPAGAASSSEPAQKQYKYEFDC
jgi:hypothetical protein